MKDFSLQNLARYGKYNLGKAEAIDKSRQLNTKNKTNVHNYMTFHNLSPKEIKNTAFSIANQDNLWQKEENSFELS